MSPIGKFPPDSGVSRRHSKNKRRFPRMTGLSGASTVESQGKIKKAHDLIRNGEHPDQSLAI
jgi:hypothetical protein